MWARNASADPASRHVLGWDMPPRSSLRIGTATIFIYGLSCTKLTARSLSIPSCTLCTTTIHSTSSCTPAIPPDLARSLFALNRIRQWTATLLAYTFRYTFIPSTYCGSQCLLFTTNCSNFHSSRAYIALYRIRIAAATMIPAFVDHMRATWRMVTRRIRSDHIQLCSKESLNIAM